MTDRALTSRACHSRAQDVKRTHATEVRRQWRTEQQHRGRVAERLAGSKQRFVCTADINDRVQIESQRTHSSERMLHGARPQLRPRRVERFVLARAYSCTTWDHAGRCALAHADIVTASLSVRA